MATTNIEHEATLWMINDIPTRMFYAGHRWRVTDTPTRLRESIWTASPERPSSLCGWRFQATNGIGEALVFDVFRRENDWHVHNAYD
ncbi:hypothetical protein [Microbacterium sulfonylureivorans]|uniref:hypothetical protein n=1 Tax=Microbacterium sulfonylureivorans TaxID=2486854 RepID=UPI000FDA41F2|nr:hypothetical protein [Microbacterium sulfonylureivorans]